jgi:isopentenyl diphosphate isomerase/L-lactate dehydrogenase-like FMN-dependent dehydrogenase
VAQDTRIDHAQRKHDHLRIVLEEEAAVAVVVTGFERYRLVHCALPELDLAEIDASTSFLGRTLRAAAASESGAHELLAALIDELRLSTFWCGAGDLGHLKRADLLIDGVLRRA